MASKLKDTDRQETDEYMAEAFPSFKKAPVPNIQKALYKFHESHIKISPQPNNRASNIGALCERQLVYNRVAWKDRERPKIERQLIFDEGNLHERQTMIELLSAGFTVVEQQVAGFDEAAGLSYHLDAILIWNEVRFPFEVKSCAPYVYDALVKYNENQFKQAMDEVGKFYPWLKKYPAQVITYCNGHKLPTGIILFKNKMNGRLKQFNVHTADHVEYYKELTAKSKRVDKLVAKIKRGKIDVQKKEGAKILPAQVRDPDECSFCDFRLICLPDVDFGQPLTILDDAAIIKRIDTWYKYALIAKEYKTLNDELNQILKGRKNTIMGKFHVDGKASRSGAWLKKITVIQDEDLEELERDSQRLKNALDGKEKK